MFEAVLAFIHNRFPNQSSIPLHAPVFHGNEKHYINQAIDSTFVSSVGEFVNRLEDIICSYSGAKHAVATVNGTSALHAALMVAGVGKEDEVLTQSISFVATANAISYCGANPLFIDVDRQTIGLCPNALQGFLETGTYEQNGKCFNKITDKRIAACVPMHTFGMPCQIDQIADICRRFHIPLIEDAAESIGSRLDKKHTGTFGQSGVYSFNGNKIITSGGGGVIITNDADVARTLKHLTTTAKKPHPYLYVHDTIGYNYRMPNINAALACAQMEQLPNFLENKRKLANEYRDFFKNHNTITFLESQPGAESNHWLNAILLSNKRERDTFLEQSNKEGIMTRPIWEPLHTLPMFKRCQTDSLQNTTWLADRIVNLPSSVRP